jgi:ferredoxin
MALKITDACTNCGACLPECPNSAISIGPNIYVIDPDRCTECVGFHADMQCALVCPSECCLPDPEHDESEADLLEKLKAMYSDLDFTNCPSRFRR